LASHPSLFIETSFGWASHRRSQERSSRRPSGLPETARAFVARVPF
jgi:hypothetical protein